MLSLRTYRKSDPSHFQPHRAAHGVNGHDAAFDEARPHFHAWPLSEKVSVAQEGDYPRSGEAVRVDSWGMEMYLVSPFPEDIRRWCLEEAEEDLCFSDDYHDISSIF